ncbi:MAG TPA: hypothetical protein VLF18_12565 [Tahibacter sp.]|uniref:hypothetical protein n=1 Tax=Tahibacter sp. TaxID=2056211 RepID=UPI002CD9518F|nr:hypothetical protein [Tahibacter sp.]HSX61028.1 hypothetical protein [Tahibacter sp.]
MNAFGGTRVDDFVDGGTAFDGLDTFASALVADAYAVREPQAQSTPERDDENVEPGHLADPLEPRKGHRPKPNEPLPVDAPPVPKLRPLE